MINRCKIYTYKINSQAAQSLTLSFKGLVNLIEKQIKFK